MMGSEAKLPRVALLGEFSAGKSTLTNLILGRAQSPVRVTATQVPPLWYRFGDDAPVRLCDDDTEEVLPRNGDIAVPVNGTRAVQVPLDAPVLQRFELLDMPGSSDPNMKQDAWDSLLPIVDIAIWCTPATQAWRQSEAAIWDQMPDTLRKRSMLLLTRIDKVGIRDKERVLKRVRDEVSGQFRHVLSAALLPQGGAADGGTPTGLEDVFASLDDLVENAVVIPAPKPVKREEHTEITSRPPVTASVVPRRVSTLPGSQKTRRRSGQNPALL